MALWMAACTVSVLAAVGPVMNQQPTVFDLIQNDPDLSEVSFSFLFLLVFFSKRPLPQTVF